MLLANVYLFIIFKGFVRDYFSLFIFSLYVMNNRIYFSLVHLSVKEKMSEMGSSYFESLVRKAKAKKEQDEYDGAIKQVRLLFFVEMPFPPICC